MTLLELYNYASAQNIRVDAFPLGKTEALSLQDEDGECFIAIDPFRVQGTADEKTKLGHELGHCMTGAFYCADCPGDVRERSENRADKWEIRALIDPEALEEAVKSGHTEVWDLAEHFGVTEALMRKAICWYRNGSLEE